MNESSFNASGAGNQEGNAINNLVNNAPKGYNSFDESYNVLFSERFADITPSFVMDCPADSYIHASFPHEQRSTALKAPVMQQVKKDKSLYKVPLSNIYHRTWSKFFPMPSKGDDVPEDCFIGFSQRELATWYNTMLQSSITNIDSLDGNDVLHVISLMTYLASNGSLFSYLRQPLGSNLCRKNSDTLLDEFFVLLVKKLETMSIFSNIANVYFSVPYSDSFIYHQIQSPVFSYLVRDILNFYIDNPGATLQGSLDSPFKGAVKTAFSAALSSAPEFVKNSFKLNVPSSDDDYTENVHRLVAYQQICAQYYSNEVTDFLFSEELYRNACDATYIEIMGSLPHFKYNGFIVQYDAFSKNWFSSLFTSDKFTLSAAHNFFSLLCSWNHSLVFSDYFTGSRTRQLAVADVMVNINGQTEISAVEIAQKLAMARFAHAVNKTSQQLYDYMKGIFNTNMRIDENFPICIAQSQFGINNSVITNVANDQGKQNSIYTDTSDSITFSFMNTVPCVVLCLDSYQYIQHYVGATDRHCYHTDRMDMFQPYLQTIGDQTISIKELSHDTSNLSPNDAFGWQVRNAEYKVRFSSVCGAMVEYFPGWYLKEKPLNVVNHINSYFVRNSNLIFDSLFDNLPFFSPAGYSHFQVSQTNNVTGIYNMIRKPQIL